MEPKHVMSARAGDLPRNGKPTVVRNYIAGMVGCPPSTVQKALRQPKWRRHLARNPGSCPLDVPITATIDDHP